MPDERDELLRRVVGLGLGSGHELLEQARVALRVQLEEGEPEFVLGAEVVEEAPLAGRRLRDHGVDARSCEAAFEYEPLGVVEDPFAVCGPVAGYGRSVGFGAAAAALLQARQTLRRKSSCEVSARFFATYAGGYAVWLLYGLSIESVPLILVDAAGLACGLVTLAVTLRMRGALLRPSTWASCPDDPPSTIDGRYGDRGLDPVSVARRNGRRGRVPRARMSES